MNIVINSSKTFPEKHIKSVVFHTRSFSHLVYVGPRTWQTFSRYYIATVENDFAGVLAVNHFGNWTKLGPLVVLPQFHRKSIGTKLILTAVSNEKNNIHLASSNPHVLNIARKLNLRSHSSILNLPFSVRMIYLKISLNVIKSNESILFLKELSRKRKLLGKRSKMRYFYKT